MTVKYFDTIPTATSIHITKCGFLLATSEVGDQYDIRYSIIIFSCLYQFVKLGEDDSAEASYSSFLGEDGTVQVPVFSPRELTNINPLDYIPSNSPLIKLLARSTDLGLTKLRNLSFSSSEIVLSVVVSTLNCTVDNKQLSINFLLKSIILFSFLNLFKLI